MAFTVLDPVADRVSLYFSVLDPVLAGTTTVLVPEAQGRVAGNPASAGVEDTEHEVAPVTRSRSTTVPSEAARADGEAVKELTTGAGALDLGAAEAVPEAPIKGTPAPTTMAPTATAARRLADH